MTSAIGELGDVATGSTPPTVNREYYDGEFLFVSPADIGTQKYITRTEKTLSSKGFARSKVYPAGSILFVCIGSTIGKVGVASVSLTSNQQINAITPRTQTDSEFLYYSLLFASPRIAASSSEQAVPILNKTTFSLARIAVPPLPEQRAIAAALSDVDAALAGFLRLIAKKRDLKQAAMQALLAGETRLPGFSGEWQVKRLGSLAAFITKGSTPTTYGFSWESSGVLFLRSECVSENGLDLDQSMFISKEAHNMLRRSEVRDGDLLVTITGNVGRVVMLASCGIANVNQHIARVRIVSPEVHAPFVYHQLNQPKFRHYYNKITTGQAYPQISLVQVRDTLVPIPALEEQVAIATVLSDLDAEIAALTAQADKTRLLKQAMMQELLTGRTRVPIQERADA